ncbi:MAG: hypothetical protein ACP6IU_02425 [Candidatus Asgardarchaeia archaeon]
MSFITKIVNALKNIFSPKVKPIDVKELIEKPKKVEPTIQKEVAEPAEVVPENAEVLAQIRKLESERSEVEAERKRVQEAIKKLDEDYAKGIITAQQRDREFGAFLRKAVNLRRRLSEIDHELAELRRKLEVAA